MSGIAGLRYLDGRTSAHIEVDRMNASLAHRGPDRVGSWSAGGVALGHRMLHTTPESLGEVLPREDGAKGLVLTADARIDNRDELIRAFGLRDRPAREVTDSELILHSYARWGEQCPEHLLGDFAFAVWDGARQRLFCARDPFGVKPLYYHHHPGRLFAFASEARGLLCLEDVPRRLNEERIGDYLGNLFVDQEITYYEGILRLPPAHTLILESSGISLRRYWQPDPGREVRLRSDEEYGEAFREVFFEAVRCRLRSCDPVGSMLSGGIDSSAIVCAARELLGKGARPPLHTFSVTFEETPEADEREFLGSVLRGGDLTAHATAGDRLNPLEDLDRVLWHVHEPPFAANLAMDWVMYKAAETRGVRVLLDGLFGDDVLCHGKERMAELLREGRLLSLARSARRLAHNEGAPAWYFLKEWAVKPHLSPSLLGLWRGIAGHGGQTRNPASLLEPDFRSRIRFDERWERLVAGRPAGTLQEAHRLAVTAPFHADVLELADRCASAFRVEARYPFLDRRLVEFCLALPPEQKFRDGWTRMIVRRGLAGVLPEEIRWRGGKAKPGMWMSRALLMLERGRLDRLASAAPSLRPYVDFSVLRDIDREYRSTRGIWAAGQLSKLLMLEAWMERPAHENRDPTEKGGARTANYQAA